MWVGTKEWAGVGAWVGRKGRVGVGLWMGCRVCECG